MQVDSLLNNITRNMEMMEIESEMRFFKGSFMQIVKDYYSLCSLLLSR